MRTRPFPGSWASLNWTMTTLMFFAIVGSRERQHGFGRIFALCPLLFAAILVEVGRGQQTSPEDIAYALVTNERAQKIVSRLGLKEPAKENRVRDQIAAFYRELNAIHFQRDTALKSANELNSDDKGTRLDFIAKVRSETESKQFRLHYAFLGRLAAELNGDEIDQVKNGITYDVVPKTYQQYLKLHPNMTAEQQRTIHALLLEAREHAMDAGSSEEKHSLFGKYKGRINNYLSAEGYDAKQAERDLKARQEK